MEFGQKCVIWLAATDNAPPPFRPSKRRKVDESPGVAFLDLHTGILACTCISSCMHMCIIMHAHVHHHACTCISSCMHMYIIMHAHNMLQTSLFHSYHMLNCHSAQFDSHSLLILYIYRRSKNICCLIAYRFPQNRQVHCGEVSSGSGLLGLLAVQRYVQTRCVWVCGCVLLSSDVPVGAIYFL